MQYNEASLLLSSIANNYRLKIFRMLIKAGSQGLTPTEINIHFNIQPNKLSFHLNHLKKLDLISSERNGRQIIYYANYTQMKILTDFLFDKCCIDSPTLDCQIKN